MERRGFLVGAVASGFGLLGLPGIVRAAGWAEFCAAVMKALAGQTDKKYKVTPVGLAMFGLDGVRWGFAGVTAGDLRDAQVTAALVGAYAQWANSGQRTPAPNLPSFKFGEGDTPQKFMGLNCINGMVIGKKGDLACAASVTKKAFLIAVVKGPPPDAVIACTALEKQVKAGGF